MKKTSKKATRVATVYHVTFEVRGDLSVGHRENVKLWVLARSVEAAVKKARAHARRELDDKRPSMMRVVLEGTIDVF